MTLARTGSASRAYRGRVLTPCDDGTTRYLDDGLVVVDGGRFTSISPFVPSHAGMVRDLRPGVLVPGFVDTHLHFPQYRIVGSATGPLLEWLEATVFPEEARFSEAGFASAGARAFVDRLVAAGTTTSCLYSSSSEVATDALFTELATSGLRAHVGLTLMDQNCPEALRVPVEGAIDACDRLLATWHGHDEGRLAFAVTPRFALSCSRPLLEAAARFAAAHDLLIQTHLSEHPREGEATLAVHSYAADYLGVYEAVGLLGARTLLAHAIHLSESEWARVRASRARIAHCPDSNFFLGSGRMRFTEARARGIAVGLGSDIGAGRSFSMRRAMGHAYDTALALGAPTTPAELLRAATLDGAHVLGLGAVTGSIESGKEADFVVLGLPEFAVDKESVLAAAVFGDEAKVEHVFVRGRAVVRG